MKIIVGLGNPGTKYQYTRHNTGFILLDALVKDLNIKKWKESARFAAKYVLDKNNDVIYLKPQDFMNNSGISVSKCLSYYKVSTEDLIVIHDDLDLPFLTVKKQLDAGSAGHNGVEDIIEKLGTKNFWRIRVGIGRPVNSKIEPSDWVLANFSTGDVESLQALYKDVKSLI